MAVYKRAYRAYNGPITAERWRFLVLTRYSLSQLFSSRAFSWFMMITLLPVLISGAFIYVSNNAAVQAVLRMGTQPILNVDGSFFAKVLHRAGLDGACSSPAGLDRCWSRAISPTVLFRSI